jgi:hypothetical protein
MYKGFYCGCCFFFLISGLPAQEEKTTYVIRDIRYHINGRTKPWALAYAAEISPGELLAGLSALDDYIARKTQLLMNQRVLEPASISLSYRLGTPEALPEDPDGEPIVPVDLFIYAEDSWNRVILPEPQYDSNSGFFLTLKARDYNFLGLLTPLKLDLGYELDDLQRQALHTTLNAALPFQAFGFRWQVSLDEEFKAYFSGEPFFSKTSAGVAVELPVNKSLVTAGFLQSFSVNEQNTDKEYEETGVLYFSEVWYLSSEIFAQWELPTGLYLGRFGELSYIPRLSFSGNYKPGGDVGPYRSGPTLTPSHTLLLSHIDWQENFRKGLSLELSNANAFNFLSRSWDISAGFSVIAHYPVSTFFGVSSRLMGRAFFPDPLLSAADTLRGIDDRFLNANAVLSLNLDLPLRILRFLPSQWFRKPSLRFFDVELHLSPFLDAALLLGSDDSGRSLAFSPRDALFCAGLELMFFSLRWRSLYLRLSAGWNLSDRFRPPSVQNRNPELFLGLGHSY